MMRDESPAMKVIRCFARDACIEADATSGRLRKVHAFAIMIEVRLPASRRLWRHVLGERAATHIRRDAGERGSAQGESGEHGCVKKANPRESESAASLRRYLAAESKTGAEAPVLL
ncbi:MULTISPECIES: hypothetical protein [Burkholderia]|uniref:hypothetical protein n=1 Tax=Burkholderia TaxID=32008 RepID=UPI000A941A4F|nr:MULTISPECIES: hypothetical protein [Burkholderia]